MNDFYNLCQEHRVWIIKYVPVYGASSVFVIWYTDSDNNDDDKLLTYNEGKIFAAANIQSVCEVVLREQQNITVSNQINNWVKASKGLVLEEDICFDAPAIMRSIVESKLDADALGNLVSLVNFYEDYIYQNNNEYNRNESIDNVWQYYYDVIFWPRFNSVEKIDLMHQFPLQVDDKGLEQAMHSMINFFDENIIVAN